MKIEITRSKVRLNANHVLEMYKQMYPEATVTMEEDVSYANIVLIVERPTGYSQ